MNHYIGEKTFFASNTLVIERSNERQRSAWRSIGASALALGIVAGSADSAGESRSTPATHVEYLQGKKANPNSFEDMTVIALEDPTDAIESRKDLGELEQKFLSATDAIAYTTDGFLVSPDSIDVVRVERKPDGIRTLQSGESVSCYSDEAFMDVRESVLSENDLPVSVRTPISVESEAFACDPGRGENVVGTFYPFKHEGGIYFKHALKGEEGAEALIIHELGHKWLRHNGAMTRGGETMPTIAEGHRDFSVLLAEGEYALQKSETDEIDVYAGSSTVMGSSDSIKHEVFNFVEINAINHEVAAIQKISEETVSVAELGMAEDMLRGISLDIPDGHPLRRIDGGESITKLHIGLNAINGDDIAELAIIAQEESGATYSISTMSYIPALDYERGMMPIFTDSSLGIQITAETTEAQANSPDGSRVSLRIQPYLK